MPNPSRQIVHFPRSARFTSGAADRRPVRVAVIGVGEMGRRHVRVLSGLDAFEVVGVMDADADVSAAVARDFDVPLLRDAAEAIARAEVVVVATPIAAHGPSAYAALEAGRHVLVEKPICGALSDAERLVALARTRGAQLYVGHSERFNPVVRALAARVRPQDVHALDFWREGPPRSARRRSASGSVAGLDDDGVLLNLGVHDIDLVALFAGGPAVLRRAEGDDARAIVTLQAHHGALARVRVDRGARARRRALTLTTADHVYEGDLLAPRLVAIPRRGGPTEDVPLDVCEPLLAQARALHEALHGRDSALATGIDGARALAIAERAARMAAGLGADATLPLAANSRREAERSPADG